MKIALTDSISDIVAHDYRTAAVFKARGIDFCCRGNRSLQLAVDEKELESDSFIKELESIANSAKNDQHDFLQWPLDLIVDYIEKKHHRYIRTQVPVITNYLNQIIRAHGKKKPILIKIQSLFEKSAAELLRHMEAEETILFPMIRNIAAPPHLKDINSCVPPAFLQNTIDTLSYEHQTEGEAWHRISTLTDQYQLAFGCNVAVITFALLKEFEDDLHAHIHLENNILFPRALRSDPKS